MCGGDCFPPQSNFSSYTAPNYSSYSQQNACCPQTPPPSPPCQCPCQCQSYCPPNNCCNYNSFQQQQPCYQQPPCQCQCSKSYSNQCQNGGEFSNYSNGGYVSYNGNYNGGNACSSGGNSNGQFY
jgi:hypothetical protein